MITGAILGSVAVITWSYDAIYGACNAIDSRYAKQKPTAAEIASVRERIDTQVEEVRQLASMNAIRIEQKIVEDRIAGIELKLNQIEYDYRSQAKTRAVIEIERMLRKQLEEDRKNLDYIKKKAR